ncbi:hypothetical protein MRX96_053840, partial [Rhipicephalus microplus]
LGLVTTSSDRRSLSTAEVAVNEDDEEQYLSAEPYCSLPYEDSGTAMMGADVSRARRDQRHPRVVGRRACLSAGAAPLTRLPRWSPFLATRGEGKSHTLNHTFYDGQRVFQDVAAAGVVHHRRLGGALSRAWLAHHRHRGAAGGGRKPEPAH